MEFAAPARAVVTVFLTGLAAPSMATGPSVSPQTIFAPVLADPLPTPACDRVSSASGPAAWVIPGERAGVFSNGPDDAGTGAACPASPSRISGRETLKLVSQNTGYETVSPLVLSGRVTGGRVAVRGKSSEDASSAVGVVHTAVPPKTAWAATRAPLPADAVTGAGPGLNAVACPSATLCVAAGNYEALPSGDGQGLLETRHGAAWTPTKGPLPAGADVSRPAVQLFGVACPSVTACVAVGSYTDSSKHSEGMLVTRHGASWTATKAPVPPDAAADPTVWLTEIACPSVTVCVAAGSYTNSSGLAQGMLVTRHGPTWTATQAPMPAGALADPMVAFTNIACPSTITCVVTGDYSDAPHSYQGLLLTGHRSSWTATKAPVPPGAGAYPNVDIAGVACPSATMCVTVGNYASGGLLLKGHGSSWTATTAPRPAGVASYQAADLRGVACPSATTCVSVGYYLGSSASNHALLLTASGSSWTATRAPLPPGAVTSQNAELNNIACPSAAACVATGSYTDTAGNQPRMLLTKHGSSWTAITAPLPTGTQLSSAPTLTDIACPVTTTCVATGQYTDSSGNQQALLLTGPA